MPTTLHAAVPRRGPRGRCRCCADSASKPPPHIRSPRRPRHSPARNRLLPRRSGRVSVHQRRCLFFASIGLHVSHCTPAKAPRCPGTTAEGAAPSSISRRHAVQVKAAVSAIIERAAVFDERVERARDHQGLESNGLCATNSQSACLSSEWLIDLRGELRFLGGLKPVRSRRQHIQDWLMDQGMQDVIIERRCGGSDEMWKR